MTARVCRPSGARALFYNGSWGGVLAALALARGYLLAAPSALNAVDVQHGSFYPRLRCATHCTFGAPH